MKIAIDEKTNLSVKNTDKNHCVYVDFDGINDTVSYIKSNNIIVVINKN